MFETIENPKFAPIPNDLTTDDPLWMISLAQITRHNEHYWTDVDDIHTYNAYETIIKDKVKDKVVCDLGSGLGVLLHLAEYHGAKECIGIESNTQAAVYSQGMYPHWNIIHNNFFKMHDWPVADIYLHNLDQSMLKPMMDKAELVGLYHDYQIFPRPKNLRDTPKGVVESSLVPLEGEPMDGMVDFVRTHDRAFKERLRLG